MTHPDLLQVKCVPSRGPEKSSEVRAEFTFQTDQNHDDVSKKLPLVLVSDVEVLPDPGHVHQPPTVVVQHGDEPLLYTRGRQHTLELSEARPHDL